MRKLVFSTLIAAVLMSLLAVTPAMATTLWVGTEDLRLPGGDKDYNDMIFSMFGPNLTVNGSGAWQPMQTPNQDGTPYFDNLSADGSGYNIGYFMTGTGAFAGNPNSPALSVSQLLYWGVGTNPDGSFQFFSTGGVSSTILAEVAGYSGSNALYWFPASNPSSLNLIFSGPNGAGTVASFNPGGVDFGLLLQSPDGNFKTTGNGEQFAVFSQVPEPMTFALIGTGLVGLGLIRRRRKTTNSKQ